MKQSEKNYKQTVVFKIGDEVIHKLTGDKMRILKLDHPVAVLEVLDKPLVYYIKPDDYFLPRAICNVKNLIAIRN